MTPVTFKTGNIVDETADGLVSSGNVQLNMSGGVNGELLRRGGAAMQAALHGWLKARNRRYVEPGFVMRVGPAPFAFKSIVYTVSVDAFYGSSVDLVTRCLSGALALLAEDGCATVAVPALATGYGNLSMPDFGRALRRCLQERAWPFSEIRVVLQREADLVEVRAGYEENTPGAAPAP
jgi:O-acetyl-ADP-ribose deacetylase (regulator of RNase III)